MLFARAFNSSSISLLEILFIDSNMEKKLKNVADEILRHDIKILTGVLNGQIDKSRQGIESTIGSNGSANLANDNGESLILFCIHNYIIICHTCLSPYHHTENEMDYISISSRWLNM